MNRRSLFKKLTGALLLWKSAPLLEDVPVVLPPLDQMLEQESLRLSMSLWKYYAPESPWTDVVKREDFQKDTPLQPPTDSL